MNGGREERRIHTRSSRGGPLSGGPAAAAQHGRHRAGADARSLQLGERLAGGRAGGLLLAVGGDDGRHHQLLAELDRIVARLLLLLLPLLRRGGLPLGQLAGVGDGAVGTAVVAGHGGLLSARSPKTRAFGQMTYDLVVVTAVFLV